MKTTAREAETIGKPKQYRVLHENHRKELHDSGLTDKTIDESGIYSETNRGKLAAIVNYKRWPANYGPTLVIPFYDEDGEIVTRRVKPANPPTDKGRLRKYIGPKGEHNHAYIPKAVWKYINDPGATLYITEGEKKALSATQRHFPCIGVTGVESWHLKQSFELLPELERIEWKGRLVYVVFDSDAVDNPNVLRGERQLAAALELRGAKVQIVRLTAAKGEKVGLDDFLVANDPREFVRLVEQAEDPDPPEAGEVRSNAKAMDPHIEAETIIRHSLHEDGSVRLRYWLGGYWWWSDGRYRAIPKDEVRAKVVQNMAERWSGVTTSHVSNVLEHLRGQVLLSSATEPPTWIVKRPEGFEAPECLATKTEIVHLPSLVEGREVPAVAATPSLFTTNATDFALDLNTPRPDAWLSFLDSLWSDDPQSIDALQEMFGYLLTPDTRQQKIFMLVGPKRSGKGTIARIMRELIGKGNVAAPTLYSLTTNFGLSPLIGKSLAIISDARLSGRADQSVVVERLLSISGEDAQTIDRKHESAITCKLPTRFVILSNELPRLNDASGAVVSRFIMLNTTQSFFGKEDHDLTEKLLAELPGILLWSIEGWRRLRDRGRLVQPDSGLESLNELNDLASPVAAFVRDCCEVSPAEVVAVSDLFDAWRQWCNSQGREKYVGTTQSFSRDLLASAIGIRKKRPRVDGGRERVYEGIGLIPGETVRWS